MAGIMDFITQSVGGPTPQGTNQGIGNAVNVSAFSGKVIFLILFGVILIFAMRIILSYKIYVTVRSNDGQIKRTRAREAVDKESGAKKLVLWWKNKKTPFPDLKYRQRIGKKDHFDFIMDNKGDIHPIDLIKEPQGTEIHLQAQPEERKSWASLERKLTLERISKKSGLKDTLIQLMPVWLALFGFLICFFLFKEVGVGLQALAAQIGQVASVCSQAIS